MRGRGERSGGDPWRGRGGRVYGWDSGIKLRPGASGRWSGAGLLQFMWLVPPLEQ